MRIRRADASDLETVAEFNALLAEESEGLALDRDRLRAGVGAVLRDESLGMYFIAESDTGAAGQLALTYEWSDWRNGMFWWLQSVYVRPEFRRQGILRGLYGHVLNLARERGVCGIRLYVEKENSTAQRAYKRLGMERAVFHMYEVDFVIERHHCRPGKS
ncbi:MAG: GNAT family N-acetyltransferase [Bryobacterales bacterium]|nr:GNAT family N-acetyltransferase [Bryobacterales bacterium]MDE0625411.1 GNAT family N-acetyltransferase [Bryobacterales bacterium]